VVLTELAAFTHFVTRVKIVPAVAEDRALAEIERKRGRDFAAALSMRVLSRTWQMLLKGIAEVKEAARPVAAAEMVLVRIAYAADLPSPDDVIRSLGDVSQRPAAAPGRSPLNPPPLTGEGRVGAGPLAATLPRSFANPAPPAGRAIAYGAAVSSPSPLVGEGWGGGSGGLAPKVPPGTTPTPDPSPAETSYTRVSATQLSDRNRQQPISIEGGERARQALAPSVAPPMRDPVSRSAETPAAAQSPTFARFSDLIAFVGAQRDLQLRAILERDVRLVRFEDGKLEIALEPSASRALIGDLGRRLAALTGRRWMVAVSAEAGEPTVKSQLDARREEFKRGVQAHPVVQRVLARFPGAEIVAVRQPEPEHAPPVAAVDDDELPPEMPIDDGGSAFGAHGRPDDVDDDL
jgi:DNA polymerase-3 subunit gamma/tau